jgi:hypothetical protein
MRSALVALRARCNEVRKFVVRRIRVKMIYLHR